MTTVVAEEVVNGPEQMLQPVRRLEGVDGRHLLVVAHHDDARIHRELAECHDGMRDIELRSLVDQRDIEQRSAPIRIAQLVQLIHSARDNSHAIVLLQTTLKVDTAGKNVTIHGGNEIDQERVDPSRPGTGIEPTQVDAVGDTSILEKLGEATSNIVDGDPSEPDDRGAKRAILACSLDSERGEVGLSRAALPRARGTPPEREAARDGERDRLRLTLREFRHHASRDGEHWIGRNAGIRRSKLVGIPDELRRGTIHMAQTRPAASHASDIRSRKERALLCERWVPNACPVLQGSPELRCKRIHGNGIENPKAPPRAIKIQVQKTMPYRLSK